jgi:dolichol-phosphate mannosyltransferase
MANPQQQPNVTIVVPTYNERENLRSVVAAIDSAITDRSWEVVFVDDDSPDGSYHDLVQMAREDPRVRFVRRVGRRGLSSACMEGMSVSPADFIAVMDADLQHDERILPRMIEILASEEADVVVGSRYTAGGSVGNWNAVRRFVSRVATEIGCMLSRTKITDPMSGFFAIRRDVYESTVRRMSGKGFKILLDLLMSSPEPLRVREVAYTFRPRIRGESKLDVVVALEYLYLIIEKAIGRYVPVRFVLYVCVGFTGLAFHLIVLGIGFRVAGLSFWTAQLIATLAAMVSNFFVNNLVTYRSSRLRGAQMFSGVLLYSAICGIGVVANVQTANYLFETGITWWFAGVVGAGLGAVWNYAVSSHLVWGWPSRSSPQAGSKK